jgi:hypothetical protein
LLGAICQERLQHLLPTDQRRRRADVDTVSQGIERIEHYAVMPPSLENIV